MGIHEGWREVVRGDGKMEKKLTPGDLATVMPGPVLLGSPTIRRRPKNEAVDHPKHYSKGGIEAIDVIESFDLNFRLGNVVKYILRAGRKGDRIEDLKKAMWYLNREIEKGSKP